MVHWNGQLWRFLPHFFEYRSHLAQRYGAGFLPEDTTIQDWGVTYDELEPYYAEAERLADERPAPPVSCLCLYRSRSINTFHRYLENAR